EAPGAHPPVAVARPPALKVDLVEHPVAVERVKPAKRLMDLVFGVADVDTVNVGRDGPFEHLQLLGIDFLVQRGPGAVQIRVIAGSQRCEDGRQPLELHAGSSATGAVARHRTLTCPTAGVPMGAGTPPFGSSW